MLADHVAAIEFVEPATVPRVMPGDADDDRIIAAAVAAGATLIVSGDSDLLRLGRHGNIAVVSAVIAIHRIAASEEA